MPPTLARHAALAVLAVALALDAGAAAAKLTVMHGFADYTSVVLWVQADRPGPVEIDVAAVGGNETQHLSLAAEAANDHVVTARIPGLAPGAAYRYRVTAQGESREGTARTQP
jgi:phosphodiesterase/alkaline phosphatase D-like protein